MNSTLRSGMCKCGAWTGTGHSNICEDCKRKLKQPTRKCVYPGCSTLFRRGSGAKHCVEHRGLKSKPEAAP